MKGARLSWLLMRRSPARAIMLVLLVAVSVAVFALVSELSRVSRVGLDSALTRDAGTLGSYSVVFDPSAGLGSSREYDVVLRVADDLGMELTAYWEDLPAVRSECPPFEELGEQEMRVLWKAPGRPYPLTFGQADIDTRWCLDGQVVPPEALFLASESERSVYGSRLYLREEYRNLVLLATTGPVRRGYTVVSGTAQGQTDAVRASVLTHLRDYEASEGRDLGPSVTVRRIDQESAFVREAAAGVGTTYGVIGWGVVLLAALALVVVQTSHVRQRVWFYGLMRSLGADVRRVAMLLVVDAGLVIVGGGLVAVVALMLVRRPVEDFAKTAFGVEAELLSTQVWPQLALGGAILLGAGVLVPLVTVLRRDPLEVLEAPRD